MELLHHLVMTITPELQERWAQLGFKLNLGFAVLDIEESDSRWSAASALVSEFKLTDMIGSTFSEVDRQAAEFLVLAAWEHGFPQPERNYAYKHTTYDGISGCQACGVGLKQVSPFRLRKAPNWSRSGFMSLSWVFDEVFVRPDIYQRHFEKEGIPFLPVLLHKTGEVLDTILQLSIQTSMDVDCSLEGSRVCSVCGQTKYVPHVIGLHPRPLGKCSMPIFRSNQWFGFGLAAERQIMVTAKLYKDLKAERLSRIQFYPCG